MTNNQTIELISVLSALPADKVDEVTDFAKFLKEKYGDESMIDFSDQWSDEDIRDLRIASLRRFELEEEEG